MSLNSDFLYIKSQLQEKKSEWLVSTQLRLYIMQFSDKKSQF